MENHILTDVSHVKRVQFFLGVAVLTFGIALCFSASQHSPLPGSENFVLGATARFALEGSSAVELNKQLGNHSEQTVVPGVQVLIAPVFAKLIKSVLFQ